MYAGSVGEQLRQFGGNFGDEEVERDAESHIVHPAAVGIEYGRRAFCLTSAIFFDRHAQWLS